MPTLQIKILNPRARNLLTELADLNMIEIEGMHPFPLTEKQKKSIQISRAQVKQGKYRSHKTVMSDVKKWLKEK